MAARVTDPISSCVHLLSVDQHWDRMPCFPLETHALWSYCKEDWVLSQYEDWLSGYRIPIIKIKWSWDQLIFIMGIPILVRRHLYINGLMQERCNSIAIALELHLSCTNPSLYWDIPQRFSLPLHFRCKKHRSGSMSVVLFNSLTPGIYGCSFYKF